MEKLSNNYTPTIWSAFVEYCKSQKWDVKEKTIDLQHKSFYRDTSELQKTLNHLSYIVFKVEHEAAYKLGFKQVPRVKREYTLWARNLHLLYGMPYEYFGFDNVADTPELFPPRKEEEHFIIQRLGFHSKKPSEVKKFMEGYQKALEKPVNDLKQSIWIYDYLGKQNYSNPTYLNPYYKIHTVFYDHFEKLLAKPNSDFTYLRFLALPLGYKLNDDLREFCNFHNYTGVLASILDLCSVELFRHICKCLYIYGDKLDREKIGFIVVNNPTRAYHWAVINEGEYIISEYNKYTFAGICKPDVLFIDKSNSANNQLLEMYQEEKESLLDYNPGGETLNEMISTNFFYDAVTGMVNYSKLLLDEAKEQFSNNPQSTHIINAQKHHDNTLAKKEIFETLRKQTQNTLGFGDSEILGI